MPICDAIVGRRLLRFNYTGDAVPGYRTVEPHTLGVDRAGNQALSAWFLEGASESNSGPGWRLYLVEFMNDVAVLPKQFSGPRPGYVPGGGKVFRSSQCTL